MVPKSQARPTRARILLVEDEVLIRAVLAEELREIGFVVIEAGHADEGWTYLTSGAPVDLIFSDVRMPGAMDGLELARRTRQRFPDLPIVLTSGNLGPRGVGNLGVFLPKPFEMARAKAVVIDILGPPNMEETE